MAFLALQNIGSNPLILGGINFMWNNGKWRTYTAVAAVAVIGTVKIVAHVKKQNRRKKWNNVGKDVVVLHMFPRGRLSPNLSPFVMKLEMYLRMADIPHQIDYEEPMGPKGKTPWITLNGEEIADSQLIMEKLRPKYGKDLSTHLTIEEKGIARAMRIMTEDHFLWCYAYWRYVLDDLKAMKESANIPLSWIFFMFTFKGYVVKMMKLQGIGRHTPQEIEEMGRKDLEALSNWLGNKPFFMGDKPTEVDCAMFGTLAQVQWNSSGSPYLRMFLSEFPNLHAYCLRIKEKYYPDWKKCLDPPQA